MPGPMGPLAGLMKMGPMQSMRNHFAGATGGPQGVLGLLQNPLFQAGMGVLGSQGDPYQNAAQGAMQGLRQAQGYATNQQMQDEQRRQQEELERTRMMIAAMIRNGGQAPAQQQQQAMRAPMNAGEMGPPRLIPLQGPPR